MRTALTASNSNARSGYALLLVLTMGAVSAIILGASVTRTVNTTTMNERNNLYSINLSAADAAVEKVIARMMADCQTGGEEAVTNNIRLGTYRTMIPTPDESAYWNQFEFTDGEGNEGQTHVSVISNRVYVPLESQYSGLSGWVTTFRVLSNVRHREGPFTIHTNAAQQVVQIVSIPLCQFAFFYNGLMEFTSARDLTVTGRVHANGDIYYSSSGPIRFNAPVTATGTIQKQTVWGLAFGGLGEAVTFNGSPNYRTNVAQLPVFAGINKASNNLYKIIEIPASDENVNSPLGRERYFNKAGMVILVTNLPSGATRVTVTVKSSASDPDPWTNSAPPFVTTTNVFKDRREGDWMKVTDIDLGHLAAWISTNSAVTGKRNPIDIIYVADNRTASSATNSAVRLINGGILQSNLFQRGTGLTVATPNPLYVQGNYNTDSKIPAWLVSDALTILSSKWKDEDSDEDPKKAEHTTINAAVITGSVPSQGPTGSTPFSGGVMNLTRLLEDWRDKDLTLNTSLMNLFDSTKATNHFNLNAYNPPRRRYFNHDPGFAGPNLPPGAPMVTVLIRAKWSSPEPNKVESGDVD